MVVLSKDEWKTFNDLVVKGLYYRRWYRKDKHSVHPKDNKSNIVCSDYVNPDDCNVSNLYTDKNPAKEYLKKRLVTISFCDDIPNLCLVSGTKVLMRNGEYKKVDDLKTGELLMTTKNILPIKHIAEIKNVFHSNLECDPEENYDVYFLDIVTTENFEFNSIFIKSDAIITN